MSFLSFRLDGSAHRSVSEERDGKRMNWLCMNEGYLIFFYVTYFHRIPRTAQSHLFAPDRVAWTSTCIQIVYAILYSHHHSVDLIEEMLKTPHTLFSKTYYTSNRWQPLPKIMTTQYERQLPTEWKRNTQCEYVTRQMLRRLFEMDEVPDAKVTLKTNWILFGCFSSLSFGDRFGGISSGQKYEI